MTITAVVHNGFPGVLLRSVTAAERITFTRLDPDGVTRPVLSGYDLVAPAGTAVAYDLAPPIGVPVTYADGVSTPATVTVTSTQDWVKSPRSPDLAVAVVVSSHQSWARSSRAKVEDVLGSGNPAVTEMGVRGRSSEMTVLAVGVAERDALETLLTSPGPLLLQSPVDRGRRDMWFVPTDLVIEQASGNVYEAAWLVTVTMTEVDAPAPQGWPMRIPGWSWADVAALYATVADVPQATVWDLLLTGVV